MAIVILEGFQSLDEVQEDRERLKKKNEDLYHKNASLSEDLGVAYALLAKSEAVLIKLSEFAEDNYKKRVVMPLIQNIDEFFEADNSTQTISGAPIKSISQDLSGDE